MDRQSIPGCGVRGNSILSGDGRRILISATGEAFSAVADFRHPASDLEDPHRPEHEGLDGKPPPTTNPCRDGERTAE
jgi:hypothetical protein